MTGRRVIKSEGHVGGSATSRLLVLALIIAAIAYATAWGLYTREKHALTDASGKLFATGAHSLMVMEVASHCRTKEELSGGSARHRSGSCGKEASSWATSAGTGKRSSCARRRPDLWSVAR